MRGKFWASLVFAMIFGGFFMNTVTTADDLNTIKASMEKRLPVLVDLKSRGIVGENAVGFLEFIGKNREKDDVVQAENQDRTKVYTAIARKDRVSAEQVGRRRALQIASKAKKGEWLQDQNGKWYQK